MTDFDDFYHKRNKRPKFNLELWEMTTGPQTISKKRLSTQRTRFCLVGGKNDMSSSL